MMTMDLLLALAYQFAVALPEVIVWVVGIVLATSRRADNPRGYRLATIAFVLFIVVRLLSAFTTIMLPYWLFRDQGATQVGAALGVVNIVYTLVGIVGWVLVLMALFGRREAREVYTR